MKASAKGVIPGQIESTVAVKMLKGITSNYASVGGEERERRKEKGRKRSWIGRSKKAVG